MLPLLISILLFAVPTSGTEGTFTALSFGKTTEDYIQFTPDMTPFASSFTSCMWINRQHDASKPIVLHYYQGTDRIILGSNGYYNWVDYVRLDLRERFPGNNQWFHYCVTWSRGGTLRVYINGEEVGSTSASSSSLTMGGRICIGHNAGSTKSSRYTFGGKLYKLNLFSEVLSSSQIRSMSEAGMCDPVELQYESRTLTWEQILTEQRFGDVTEFVLEECYVNTPSYLKTKLNETKSELRETQDKLLDKEARLNRTENQVEELSTALNRTESKLEETRMQLKNSKEEVEEIKSALLKSEETVNSTQQKLSEVSETLNDTRTELGNTETLLNLSQSELAEKEGILNNTEIELTEARTQLSEMERKLNESETRLSESETRLSESETRLSESETRLRESETRLRESETRLRESETRQRKSETRLSESETRLRESETRLNETLSELEGGRKIEEVSRWDVLLTHPYFNKLFTRQLYLQLIGSWDMMGKYYILSFSRFYLS